jgi:hypothetical protein
MYGTLAAGVADRTVTTQDLNIPDPPAGADPQKALPLPHVIAPPLSAPPTLNQNVGLMAWDLAVAELSWTGLIRTQRTRT